MSELQPRGTPTDRGEILREPQPYRVRLLLSTRATSAERKAVESLLSSWVSEHGGSVQAVTAEEKRKLSYPIRKEAQAVVLHASFRAPPDDIQDLTARLARETAVLRSRLFRGEVLPGKRIQEVPLRKPEAEAGKSPRATPRKEKVPLEKLEEKIDEILKEEVL